MTPFRDDREAARVRADELEEENERLRTALAEAKRPKQAAQVRSVARTAFIALGAGVGLLLIFGEIFRLLFP